MTTVESGPARADRNYWLLVSTLCVGMCGWFIYDGAVGWPGKNRVEAEKQLRNIPGMTVDVDRLGELPTEKELKLLQSAGSPLTIAQIRTTLGAEPAHRVTTGGETIEYYPSKYGLALVAIRDGAFDPGKSIWRNWYKGKDDIRGQYYWAAIPALIALYAIRRTTQAATLTARVDDSGLTYAGRLIPFDSITALRDYNPKGWVDLYYKRGAVEERLRLDNQKLARFDEIVESIAQAKGLANPVTAQRQEDQEQADASET